MCYYTRTTIPACALQLFSESNSDRYANGLPLISAPQIQDKLTILIQFWLSILCSLTSFIKIPLDVLLCKKKKSVIILYFFFNLGHKLMHHFFLETGIYHGLNTGKRNLAKQQHTYAQNNTHHKWKRQRPILIAAGFGSDQNITLLIN